MEDSKNTITRKKFIKNRSSRYSIPNLGIFSAHAKSAGDTLGTKRTQLKEAGSMLPPVSAVLLTVNGLKEGKDEISVVWIFIVEGAASPYRC